MRISDWSSDVCSSDLAKNSDAVWNTILEQGGSVQHLDFLSAEEKDCYKTSFEIDQRWLLELAGDRAPFIDQAQSLNLFIPADVEKWDLLMRSEEHTSELQSLMRISYAVFCFKQKTQIVAYNTH